MVRGEWGQKIDLAGGWGYLKAQVYVTTVFSELLRFPSHMATALIQFKEIG